MYCPNCGTKLPDETVFCNNCGARVAGGNTPQQTQPQPQPQPLQIYQNQPQQHAFQAYQQPQGQYQQPMYGYNQPYYAKPKKKTGLVVGIIASVAVVAAVAIVLIFTLGGGTSGGASSPTDAVQTFFDAYEKGDCDAIVEVMPDFVLVSIAEEYSLPSGAKKSEIAEAMGNDADFSQELTYISQMEISDIKLVKTVHKSESGFNDYLNTCMEKNDFKEGDYDIEAFAEVSYKINITYMGYDYSQTITGTCVKIGGNWYISDMGNMGY